MTNYIQVSQSLARRLRESKERQLCVEIDQGARYGRDMGRAAVKQFARSGYRNLVKRPQLERARRDRGERELLRSVTLEPDVFHTAGIAVFFKMQRTYLPEVPSITSVEERRGGPGATFAIRGPRDGGTQYAQRTGETVSGMKTTAGDSERGHKGRAACLHSFDFVKRPLVHVSGLLLISPKTPEDDPSQPKSTRDDPSQPESTQVNPSRPKSTQVDPSQPK
ncbi:hypothetical protein DPMN_110016 [Dreissena polymorpha]|uniref:Uncharacterized protein n=1 Tax=Dreissena polymorpha TaxID=45954 RepID=A0A9D4KBB1_DREPO|nr:hypothetical protein DPMN_110016 [Dreissena polymorpha]